MSRQHLLRSGARTLGSVLLLAAFAAAVVVFLSARAVHLPPRANPPSLTVADVPLVHVAGYNDALPVLVYHDIADRAGRYTVHPQAFAEQMATLRRSGFHTVSAAQTIGFLHGHGGLPDRPLLITFDDGLGSAWRVADPILKRYGFRAVNFVISGQLGHHGFYYLHPREVQAMIRSGRWDVEAHTHLAHLYVQTDKYGAHGPALTNREWLQHKQRLETSAEFAARVRQDLDLNLKELRAFGADPQLFAYPFSASRTPTNDKAVVPILNQLVQQRFPISFVDAAGTRFLTQYDDNTQQLPRIEVYHDTSARALLQHLGELAPLSPHVANAFAGNEQWISEGGKSFKHGLRRGSAVLSLRSRPRHWLAAYLSPSRTELWHDYRVGVTMQGLGREGSGTSETLIIGARNIDRYAVTLSAARVSVQWLPTERQTLRLRRATIPDSGRHRLQVALTHNHLQVAVDGRSLLTIAVDPNLHGGIGLGVWRELAASPLPTFARLSLAPSSGGA